MDATTAPRPARPFKVVFDIAAQGQRVRVARSFRTADDAVEYAELCTPEVDDTVFPNVRDESWEVLEAEGYEYWKGIRWHSNRPAVVMSWNPYAAG